jgi:hypothetical protein
MITLARAATTLRAGRLITKQAAIAELPSLGAPLRVVRDIEKRRYGGGGSPAWSPWRLRRGELARAFVRSGIDRVS